MNNLILIFCFSTTCFSFGQNVRESEINLPTSVASPTGHLISKKDPLPQAKEGTFQFIVQDAKFLPVFTTDILTLIEKQRKDTVDVVYKVNDNVSIYIPSIQKIESKDFNALELYSF